MLLAQFCCPCCTSRLSPLHFVFGKEVCEVRVCVSTLVLHMLYVQGIPLVCSTLSSIFWLGFLAYYFFLRIFACKRNVH